MTATPRDLTELTKDSFAPYLEQTFEMRAGDAVVKARLAEVKGGAPAAAGMRAQFSLVFVAPSETSLPQAMFRVSHHEFGTADLFLVPIGPGRAGMRYQAVFN